MMTLIGLAISVAFVYSVAVSAGLLQGMPLYWELATLSSSCSSGTGSRWLRSRGPAGVEHLVALVPAEAHRMVDDRVEDVPVSELRVGDQVFIRPGEQIPVDGVVVDGPKA